MCFRVKKEVTKVLRSVVCSLFVMLIFSSTLYADWEIYKKVQIRNSQKHYLLFDTSNEKNIEVCFMVTKNDKGVFSKKLPIYRVDNNDIHQVSKGKAYAGLKIRKGRWIRWVISDGEKASKELKEFINGKVVVFQYYRDDGKIMETSFPLEGLKKTISALTGKHP